MTKTEAVKSLAKWWRNTIEDRAKMENKTLVGVPLNTLRQRTIPDQFEAFERLLAERVEADMPRCIWTDYGPCIILDECAEAAGIPRFGIFPIKTATWMRCVGEDWLPLARYGDGAPLCYVTMDGALGGEVNDH